MIFLHASKMQHAFPHCPVESAANNFEPLIVYLADTISVRVGLKSGCDRLVGRLYEAALRCLNLSEDDIRKIVLRFSENKQKVEGLLAVI